MTQQSYGAPPPGYAPPQYQQPGQPPFPTQQPYPQPGAPATNPYPQGQQPQYAPPAPQQYQPAPMALDTLGGREIKQVAPATLPSFTDLEGRLLYVLPKSIDSSGQFGDKIIADVVFFDGAPITATIRDKQIVTLTQPVMPGQLMPDLWITSSRIVSGLREMCGRTNGFAVRLAKEGKAFVLRDATPAEASMVAQQVQAIRAGQAGAAVAANPFLNGQTTAPAPVVAQQPLPQQYVTPAAAQYAQQYAVPSQGAVAEVAGQQFVATGQGPFPGQPYPDPALQGAPSVPPPPPEQPSALTQAVGPPVFNPNDPAFLAWQAQQAGQPG